MSQPTAALIISTHQAPAVLNRVLLSVAAQTQLPEEIIIAEDSRDPQIAFIVQRWQKRHLPQLTHVSQRDIGFRRARILNIAIAQTTADYLIFLDGDCLPHRQFIADHLALAEPGYFVQGRRAFIAESAVPAIVDHGATIWRLILSGKVTGLFKAIRWPWPIIKYQQSAHKILGCNLAIWRQDFLTINGYDEAYVGWGREDSDLAYRLTHTGLRCKRVYGRALAYHLNHPILSRAQLAVNQQRLEHTIATRKVRCERGLADHRPPITTHG